VMLCSAEKSVCFNPITYVLGSNMHLAESLHGMSCTCSHDVSH